MFARDESIGVKQTEHEETIVIFGMLSDPVVRTTCDWTAGCLQPTCGWVTAWKLVRDFQKG